MTKGCMKDMKKKVLAFAAAAVLMAPQMVGAEGFAIYEWSAEGLAMGGARMFAEMMLLTWLITRLLLLRLRVRLLRLVQPI